MPVIKFVSLFVSLTLVLGTVGCHSNSPVSRVERSSSVTPAVLRVQSLPQYKEAEAACTRKEYRKAADLLQRLPQTVALTSEEQTFCNQQRDLCLREAGLLPPEPKQVAPTRKPSNANCGPLALMKACDCFGISTTLGQVRQLAGTSAKGTSMKGLSKAATALGLKAEGVQVSREALAEMSVPAIAWVEEDHYITVLGLYGSDKGGTANIYDPNTNREEVLTQDKLLRACSGYLLLLRR